MDEQFEWAGQPLCRGWEDRGVTMTLHDFDGEHSLTLDAGDLASDAAVVAAGHEPNGYFWEGLVQFAWPDLAERLDFDSEGGMFCALGSLSDLTQLKTALEPVISNPGAVRKLIARAETAGFEFDD
ncbi:Imm51 family immunity protein [Streptomyces sp. NPDC048664]|uniref:Imm51 family immunity protein n=1 Tax=Streptomyces TaxID=1883 RepID=UPI0033A61DDB